MEMNPTRNHEVAGSIPDLTQWVKDLELLWLWCRPAATALIGPLAWKPPYAMGTALEDKKTKKKNAWIKKMWYVCVHIYTHTHVYTHMHTYTHICSITHTHTMEYYSTMRKSKILAFATS